MALESERKKRKALEEELGGEGEKGLEGRFLSNTLPI